MRVTRVVPRFVIGAGGPFSEILSDQAQPIRKGPV